MADKHPYMSGGGALTKAIAQLRRSFPPVVDAKTLKKLGIAPNNEGFLINILRFIGVIDEESKKTAAAGPIFAQSEDDAFQTAFSKLVKNGYADLFELHGEDAWTLPAPKLISYFRNADHSSEIVGQRQATTFQTLAALSGKIEGTAPRTSSSGKSKASAVPKARSGTKAPTAIAAGGDEATERARAAELAALAAKRKPEETVGLTVRIEINLPAQGDQATYDRIFKSIRENLLNGRPA